MTTRIGLIWAEAEGSVIGRDGGMPWHVPEDLAHFKALTSGSPVVMGRGTWDSLDPRWRPLPGRRNIVVTRQDAWSAPGAERAASLDDALELAADSSPEWIWVIGGGAIFDLAIGSADRIEKTELRHPDGFAPQPGDVIAPWIDPERFAVVESAAAETSTSGIGYRFIRYERLAPA